MWYFFDQKIKIKNYNFVSISFSGERRTSAQREMAFQRSYSKVWWGSDNMGYSSLPYSGNLSRIQEVDDENSKLWGSHNSPGSLRSQVSKMLISLKKMSRNASGTNINFFTLSRLTSIC